MNSYPEHEKLSGIKEVSQALGSILERLQSQGYILRKWDEGDDYSGYIAINKSITQILADYYKIDLVKLEEEKQQMLNEIRNK